MIERIKQLGRRPEADVDDTRRNWPDEKECVHCRAGKPHTKQQHLDAEAAPSLPPAKQEEQPQPESQQEPAAPTPADSPFQHIPLEALGAFLSPMLKGQAQQAVQQKEEENALDILRRHLTIGTAQMIFAQGNHTAKLAVRDAKALVEELEAQGLLS